MSEVNYTDKILEVFKKMQPSGIGNEPITYIRATDDKEVKEKLSVRIKSNVITDDVFEFLDKHNEEEKIFYYKDVYNAIWAITHLNPREENKYESYFHLNEELLQKFDKLLEKNKMTFLLGKKGTGKTLTQNVWLYNNNKLLEKNKIFWVRLDVEKLYRYLWQEGAEITTEEYLIGQLLYVFCKRFKRTKYIDDDGKEKYTNSELITEIYDCLCKSDLNNISHNETLYKSQMNLFNDAEIFFNQKLKETNCSTISDYLRVVEKLIAIYENTYQDELYRKNEFKRDRKKSYLLDKVFKPNGKVKTQNGYKETFQFTIWIYLGKLLKDFILRNDYCILYLVDGIDNINFEDAQAESDYKKLLKQLLEFPLNDEKVGHNNELIFMAMRYNTFEELKKNYNHYGKMSYFPMADKIRFENLEKEMANEILVKRIEYILNTSKHSNKTYMAEVLKWLKENHKTCPFEEDKTWNSNYRSLLQSHVKLAKYLTFRYYWEKHNNDNIKRGVETHENINFYLGGEMYADDKKITGDDDGSVCFNLFGFIDKENHSRPLYFSYTYILLAIQKLKEDRQDINSIINVMKCFDISTDNTKKCVHLLLCYGMLEQRYEEEKDCFAYNITTKGIFILEKFYNDVQYLYFSCLDTLLPEAIFNSIKNYISPNNVTPGENRDFLPNCIITGTSFLNFLEFQNQQMLNDKEIKEKLSNMKLEIDYFKLPINNPFYAELFTGSIDKIISIIEASAKRDDYIKKIDSWLQTMGGKK